jgi:hypothetical protein
MFRKLVILICLVSLCPAAAGAQDLAAIASQQPSSERAADREPAKEINLSPSVEKMTATILAANDMQGVQATEEQRPKKTHSGLTFKEFCEIHFGEYRWVYWVGAAAVLVAIHVVATD